jgi:hypothetical protein
LRNESVIPFEEDAAAIIKATMSSGGRVSAVPVSELVLPELVLPELVLPVASVLFDVLGAVAVMSFHPRTSPDAPDGTTVGFASSVISFHVRGTLAEGLLVVPLVPELVSA